MTNDVSEDKSRKRMTRAREAAQHAVTPGAIIISIATAVTAYYKANDTSIEKKTYETLSSQVAVIQSQNQTLNERMGRFEQALIISAMNGSGRVQIEQPSSASSPVLVPTSAPAPSSVPRPSSTGSRTGSISSINPWKATEAKVAEAKVRKIHRTAVETSTPMPEEDHNEKLEAMAKVLGRGVVVKDGALQIEPPPPAEAVNQMPTWNDIETPQ